MSHVPVLLQEIIHIFEPVKIRYFFDGTVGAGGHAQAILESHPEIETYFAGDRDQEALKLAAQTLAPWRGKVQFIHGNHSSLKKWQKEGIIPPLQGILVDAGISSMQLDQGERGFSFQREGPLDMRMDITSSLTAAEIVNSWREEDIARILYEYGEEHRSRQIARAIVHARRKNRLRSTQDLVDAIRGVAKGKPGLHFATLTFQALRIAVNQELEELELTIRSSTAALTSGGRLAFISFHRLEDRIVKQALREGVDAGLLQLVTRKAQQASQAEKRLNPRSRSAKLRAAERL